MKMENSLKEAFGNVKNGGEKMISLHKLFSPDKSNASFLVCKKCNAIVRRDDVVITTKRAKCSNCGTEIKEERRKKK